MVDGPASTLFDLEPVIARTVTPRSVVERRRAVARMTKMHGLYGHGPTSAKCGTCTHLTTREETGRYFKCKLFGNTRSAASDWRKGWPACGKYERPAEETA